MNQRPAIFISAASGELRTARGFVSRLLDGIGYDAKDQDMAAADHGSLSAVLRRWIDLSEGVIQLVGKCSGAEPVNADGTPQPDPEFGRCSYTQLEARYARSIGKPVWYFFVGNGYRADPHDPEPPDLSALQRDYIEGIGDSGDFRHTFSNDAELEAGIRDIGGSLMKLRRAWWDKQPRPRSFPAIAKVAVALLAGFGIIGVRKGWWEKKEAPPREIKVEDLTSALTEYIQRNAAAAAASSGEMDSDPLKLFSAEMGKKYGMSASDLERKLRDLAWKRSKDADLPKLDRAEATYIAGGGTRAGRIALEAAAEAEKGIQIDRHRLVSILELSGWSALDYRNREDALAYFTGVSKLTDKAADPLEWARISQGLAHALSKNGQAAAAASLAREVIAIHSEKLGAEHAGTLASRNTLAVALEEQGKHAEAEAEHREMLAIRERVLGSAHPDTRQSRDKLAIALYAQGKYAESEAEYRVILGRLGGGGRSAGRLAMAAQRNLGLTLQAQGKYSEAAGVFYDLLAGEESLLGKDHFDTVMTRKHLADALLRLGEYAEAEEQYRAVLRFWGSGPGPGNITVAQSCHNLSVCLELQADAARGTAQEDTAKAKKAEALALARRALAIYKKTRGDAHPDTQHAQAQVADLEKP